jgi:hypothetical protein
VIRPPTARQLIIAHMARLPWASEVNRTDLAATLGRPASTIRHVFSDLVKEGVISHSGGRPWYDGGPVEPDRYELSWGYRTEKQATP